MLDTVPTPIAFSAACIFSIARAADFTSDRPPPLNSVVPVEFSASEPAWVIRIGSGNQYVFAFASGVIRIEYVQKDALLAMPTLRDWGFGLFSNVILADGKPSALVVNANTFFRTRQGMGK